MTRPDTTRPTATGGRRGADAPAPRGRAATARREAVPHADDEAVRARVRGGARAARAQRRHDSRKGRRRDPRLPVRRSNGSRDAGADVDGTRVRFPRGMCRQIVQATAPAIYTQHARNPEHSVQIGGDATVFAPNYGSPFVHDLDNGRRYATIADFQNFVKLAYMSPYLHHSGGTVCEPVDVPVHKRHLDMVYAPHRYSDKPFMGSVTAGERAADCVELARIAFGGDLQDRTVMTSLINASSPLVWDERCSPRRRSTPPPIRRRSLRRSSSPGRWHRRRRQAWRRRHWPSRWPGWRSHNSSGPAHR